MSLLRCISLAVKCWVFVFSQLEKVPFQNWNHYEKLSSAGTRAKQHNYYVLAGDDYSITRFSFPLSSLSHLHWTSEESRYQEKCSAVCSDHDLRSPPNSNNWSPVDKERHAEGKSLSHLKLSTHIPSTMTRWNWNSWFGWVRQAANLPSHDQLHSQRRDECCSPPIRDKHINIGLNWTWPLFKRGCLYVHAN